MRSLLELWYDEWHFQRWKGKDSKAPTRPSEYKVFKSIAQSHRQRLCTRVVLPKAVKDIFQKPKDEDDWLKLEQFRRALLRIVQGEDWLLLESPEEVSAIALAVEGCANDKFPDEVGRGCRIPEGARLQVDGPRDTKEDILAAVSALGDEDVWLRYLSRPMGTKRAPPVDAFCKNLFVDDMTAEQIAGAQSLSAAAFLDRMLLCLFDALWLKQSEEWSLRGVANMPSDEPYEIAKWFMKGHHVGRKPLFDGIGSRKTLHPLPSPPPFVPPVGGDAFCCPLTFCLGGGNVQVSLLKVFVHSAAACCTDRWGITVRFRTSWRGLRQIETARSFLTMMVHRKVLLSPLSCCDTRHSFLRGKLPRCSTMTRTQTACR